MPSPTTAYELIKGAFRRAGITTSGETPTADEANDALADLNDLIEVMSTENLFVYGQLDESFNTVAGQAVYTIGNYDGGTFAGIVTSGSAVITGATVPSDMVALGDLSLAGYIAPGATIVSFNAGAGTVTMSANAIATPGSLQQISYTIPGNFKTKRPVRIESAYCTVQGVDYEIQLFGGQEYDAIALKSEQQQIIERLYYNNDFPLGRISLWPTPSAIVSLVLSTDRILTAIPSTATRILLPPGYLAYMKHALALMVAPDYGIELSQTVAEIARAAKADIKRANKVKRVARFDSMLADSNPTTWRNGV